MPQYIIRGVFVFIHWQIIPSKIQLRTIIYCMFLSFKASSVTLRPSLFGIWNILLQYLISHSYIIAKIGYFNNKAFTLVLRGRSNKINHWFLLVIREFYSKDIITWPTYSYRVVPSRHILGKRSKSARIFTNSSLSDWPWIIMSTMYSSTLMYMSRNRGRVRVPPVNL